MATTDSVVFRACKFFKVRNQDGVYLNILWICYVAAYLNQRGIT